MAKFLRPAGSKRAKLERSALRKLVYGKRPLGPYFIR